MTKPTHPSSRPAWPWTRTLAVLTLLVLSGLAGTTLARWMKVTDPPAAVPQNADLPGASKTWAKPDLAVVLSGQQHGYLLPCGCSRPQLGGLERRYNFIQKLRGLGWPVAAVDLGDIPQHEAPAHLANNLVIPKYQKSMQALKLMGYNAVGVGAIEIEQPLLKTFSEYALNNGNDCGPPYLVAANLQNAGVAAVGGGIKPWVLIETPGSGLKVAVTSIIGPSVRSKVKDGDTTFTETAKAMEPVLKAMAAAKADVRILLYHGSAEKANAAQNNPPEAIACAKAFPDFQIVVCLDDDDLAPNQPLAVMQTKGAVTRIIRLGHKGKAVGLLGIYRGKPGEPLRFEYQLAEMTEAFVTPVGKEAANPVLGLMEEYAKDLKEKHAVENYPQTKHPLQLVQGNKIPEYVGSDACKTCHASAYKVWMESKGVDPKHPDKRHSNAFQTLVDAKHPSLRQFDPECVVCHTVGFGRNTGYTDDVKTPALINVGCESCHGPASLHVDNSKDKEWRAKLNPWKAPPEETEAAKAKRLDRIDQMCQSCHDIDNDVNYVNGGFNRYWPLIEHKTPPKPKP